VLARVLQQVVAAGIPLDVASEHGVSEAIYLRDQDQNGVELNCDRDAIEWSRYAHGGLTMINAPLDLDETLAEA
jgi:catechol 2,3-dioxygenase